MYCRRGRWNTSETDVGFRQVRPGVRRPQYHASERHRNLIFPPRLANTRPPAWQREREAGPRTQRALGYEIAVHHARQIAADRQAKSYAVLLTSKWPAHLHERLEAHLGPRGGNAPTRVPHVEVDRLLMLHAIDRDGAIGAGELDRVGDEVDENLPRLLAVGPDAERRIAPTVRIGDAFGDRLRLRERVDDGE